MHNKNNYVLVLGSKPHSPMPNIEVTDVYAANGAAERAKLIKLFSFRKYNFSNWSKRIRKKY